MSVDLNTALIKDEYEKEEHSFTEACLREGVDIIAWGGSIGVMSAFTRSRMVPDARQIVVEAVPEVAEMCAAQDSEAKGKVVHAAVRFTGAETSRFMSVDNPYVGRIVIGERATPGVPIVRLEQLCADIGITQFALICDIEGGEVELFMRSDTWKTHRRLIVLETHPNFYASDTSQQHAPVAQFEAIGVIRLGESRGVYAFGKT